MDQTVRSECGRAVGPTGSATPDYAGRGGGPARCRGVAATASW